MKKSCKIFSAVALSAALAVGTTMPAFANTVDDITGDDLQNGNNSAYVNGDGTLNKDYWKDYDKDALAADGASTNVNIATYSSNYSVTVPLFAPFMLDTAGGTGIAPTNYGIINGGEAAVFVTNVKWTMTEDGDWTFGDEANGLGSDGTPLPVVQKKGGTPGTTTLPTYGSFVITLTPDNEDAANNINTPVNTYVPSPTGTAANAATASKTVKWIILPDDAKTSKVNESFNNIGLGIMGSKLFKSLDSIQTSVAAITYTVDSRAPENPTI